MSVPTPGTLALSGPAVPIPRTLASSGPGVQFYSLQDGSFYNTGGSLPSTFADKTGNTILECRHHWTPKGHELCHGNDAEKFKYRLCLDLPLLNGINSWQSRCLSWRLDAPNPLPEKDCYPMIRAARRNRLVYDLFPDGDIPADFIEAWRHWAAAHPASSPSPRRESIDNGEGSSRQSVTPPFSGIPMRLAADNSDHEQIKDRHTVSTHKQRLANKKSTRAKGNQIYAESEIVAASP
ncbi:hypothetical protein BGZ95_008008, partial [Linnemannia exigua]